MYVPEQYERDALYVFTPDVMHELIKSGHLYDMEIVDNELYMYQPIFIDLSSESKLKEVLAAVNAIASELRNQTKRYTDERIPVSSVQSVGVQGRRLKKGINWLVVSIVSVVIMINIFTFFSPKETVIPIMLLVGACFWGIIIIAIVRSVKNRR